MRDYVMRISKYSKCSNVCGVMAYSYLQRLAKVPFRPAHLCIESLPTAIRSSADILNIDMLATSVWCALVYQA